VFLASTHLLAHDLAAGVDYPFPHRDYPGVPRPPLVPMAELLAAYEAGETTLRPLAAYLDRTVDDLRAVVEPARAARPLPEDEKGDPVFQP
jgi:hypothetical protein